MSSPSLSSDSKLSSLPRLPTELLFEVLSNDWFNLIELAGFAKVSRQWLEPARKALYGHLRLELGGLGNRGNEDITLSTQTRKMLSTLRESLELAKLVRTVEITTHYETDAREPTAETTTIESVVSEFFDLASKMESVHLDLGDDHVGPFKAAFTKHGSRIKYFVDVGMGRRKLELIDGCFPNLQQLKTGCLPVTLPPRILGLRLSDVDLGDEGNTDVVTAFLDSSASSLRRLSVRLCVAAELDYSKYPGLEYLHIYADFGSAYDPTIPRRRQKHDLWTRLSEAHSLTTLSFDGEAYGGTSEEELFATWGLGKQSSESLFTKIKRIEHRGGVKLDRMAALMQHAWLPVGLQIVVPFDPFIEEQDRHRFSVTNLLQINALSAMCYTHDAELIFGLDQL